MNSKITPDAQWLRRDRWGSHYELEYRGRVLASLRVRGWKGTAQIGGRTYQVRKIWLSSVTLRDVASRELIARLVDAALGRGMLAQFDTGQEYCLVRRRWFDNDWCWIAADGQPVSRSTRRWFSYRVSDVFLEDPDVPHADCVTLSVLELSRNLLSSFVF